MAKKKRKRRKKRTVFQKEELVLSSLILLFTIIAVTLIVVADMSQDSGLGNIGLAAGLIVFFLGLLNWMFKQSHKRK